MGKYAKLSLDLIDEGRFGKDINDAIQTAAKGLLAYRKKHGKEKTSGAKAEVVVKVIILSDKENTDAFYVKGQIQEKIPSRPPVVSMAIEDEEQDGEDALFMRKSGGTADSPRQAVLSTLDGETVDPKTGEVMRGKRAAAGE